MLVKECQRRINSHGEVPVAGRRSAKVKSDEGTGLVRCFHAGSRSYRGAAKSEWQQQQKTYIQELRRLEAQNH